MEVMARASTTIHGDMKVLSPAASAVNESTTLATHGDEESRGPSGRAPPAMALLPRSHLTHARPGSIPLQLGRKPKANHTLLPRASSLQRSGWNLASLGWAVHLLVPDGNRNEMIRKENETTGLAYDPKGEPSPRKLPPGPEFQVIRQL